MAEVESIPRLIEEIFDLRAQITHLLGGKPPRLYPPASPDLIAAAEQKFEFLFPTTFREFLSVCDGFERFSEGFDLLGVQQMLSAEYEREAAKIRDLAWQSGERIAIEGLIIGLRPGSFRVLLFDRTAERDDRGELPVVEWKFEPLARSPDFRAFLVLWREAAQKTYSEARKLAAKKPPQRPEQ
jgi:hypothetical protein